MTGPLTLREIAKRLGISHVRAYAIEQRALKKLKKAMEERAKVRR